MSRVEIILKAIEKMPKSTEVWLNNKHDEEDFSALPIKVKFSPLIPVNQFILSEKDLSKEIEASIKNFK